MVIFLNQIFVGKNKGECEMKRFKKIVSLGLTMMLSKEGGNESTPAAKSLISINCKQIGFLYE